MAPALPRIWPDAIVSSSPKKYFASQLDAERGVTQLAAIESVHVAFYRACTAERDGKPTSRLA